MWFVVGGVCEIWLVVGYDFDVFDCVFVKLWLKLKVFEYVVVLMILVLYFCLLFVLCFSDDDVMCCYFVGMVVGMSS